MEHFEIYCYELEKKRGGNGVRDISSLIKK